jgi:hypothetical protein
MRLSQAATVGALVSLALVLPACGAENSPVAGGAKGAPVADRAKARAARAPCARQLRPLLASLDALREDLAVGLSYDGYMRELRGVRGAHRRIRAGRLQIGCLIAAGAPAERALNRYIEAANVWGGCLATAACEIASIERRLQRRWARASDLLSAAQAGA